MFIDPIPANPSCPDLGATPPHPVFPPALAGPRFQAARSARGEASIRGWPGRPAQSVDIVPAGAVTRRALAWKGMMAESIEASGGDSVEFRSRGPLPCLVVYETGKRISGESMLGTERHSSRKDVGRKLTFVPAGQELRERHHPQGPLRLMYLFFDPAQFPALAHAGFDAPSAASLHFDDPALTETALKLKRTLDGEDAGMETYLEALGIVLVHDLARLLQGLPRLAQRHRGGLAAWQQRAATSFIDAHLEETIPLATLAALARLSPYHFCRAFKQSLGMPPHKYHTQRRMEHAKSLLAGRTCSVTEIGLAVGYSETSSFTTAFRKATGTTPSAYQRMMA